MADPAIQADPWAEVPVTHPRRIGLHLSQAGLVTVLALVCVSVAGVNLGLTAAWVGALIARLPVHRAIGFWPGLAYVAWQVISRLAGPSGQIDFHGLGQLYTWSGLLLVQVALTPGVPGAAVARAWGLRLLALAAAASGLVGVLQFAVGYDQDAKPLRIGHGGERFHHSSGFFSIHLTQGVVLAAVALVATCRPLWHSIASAWRQVALAAGVVAVGVSGGRLAFLGLGAGWTVGLMARGRRFAVRGVLAGLAVGAVAVLVMAISTPDRLRSTLALQDGRWPIWRTSLAIATAHPVLGTGGPVAFRTEYHARYAGLNPEIPDEFPEGAPHAHNSLLALAAEHGLPAVALYLFLLTAVAVALWRLTGGGPEGRTAMGLIALFVVAGQFENLAGQNVPSQCLWTLLGLLAASHFGRNPESTLSLRDQTFNAQPTLSQETEAS
jgi:O-antigen ligase